MLFILIAKLIEYFLMVDAYKSSLHAGLFEDQWQQSGLATLWMEVAMIVF
jgi:hypothetical protein